jgi:hypothetical protein
VRRPVSQPRGSGRRHEAAAQAVERAALGLAQILKAPKRPVGRPRKDEEDLNGVFVELRPSVSLILFVSFDGLSGHTRIPSHSNSSTECI